MASPTTLRTIMGLASTLPSLGDSALVMIDLQNTYREGMMQLAGVEPALAEAKILLERARAAGSLVIHIRHEAGAGSPYDTAARIGQISDEVAPRGGEAVITKSYPDAFVGTDLEEMLRAAGRTDVVLAGFMTHMCINSTARGAFNRGFRPVVVTSTTATRDLPGPDGAVVPAAAIQAASLGGLAVLFAVLAPRASDLPS